MYLKFLTFLCIISLAVEVKASCKNGDEFCMTDSQCCSNKCDMVKCRNFAKGCKPGGESCFTDSTCCSNKCDGFTCRHVKNSTELLTTNSFKSTNSIVDTPKYTKNPTTISNVCKKIGLDCKSGKECCSEHCEGNRCSDALSCKNGGEMCATDSQCCTNKCDFLKCREFSKGCKEGGESCLTDGNCCSHKCDGLTCRPIAGKTCKSGHDLCITDSQCCSNKCDGVKCRPFR